MIIARQTIPYSLWQAKKTFFTEILHFPIVCNHKHMVRNGAPPDNLSPFMVVILRPFLGDINFCFRTSSCFSDSIDPFEPLQDSEHKHEYY